MEWISTEEAALRLGVKRETLYAYVSRGILRATPHKTDPRASLYAVDDLERLSKRRKAGRKRADIAEASIAWGDPVLSSAIATVRDSSLIYRGHDAITLSAKASFEETARLLWSGQAGQAGSIPLQRLTQTTGTAKARALHFLAKRAASDPPCFGRAPEALAAEAEELLAGVLTGLSGREIVLAAHLKLAQAWSLPEPRADLLRRTLVLLADHELNPSTFAARIAASTGASLAAACLAGFATLTGPRHGEASARALDFLNTGSALAPELAISQWLARGQPLPAMRHPLYPSGDPRAASILAALKPSPKPAALIAAAEAASGEKANVDMALAALTFELKLAPDAPFTLFAAARMAGWLAHAMEQVASGKVIRPRAGYIGG